MKLGRGLQLAGLLLIPLAIILGEILQEVFLEIMIFFMAVILFLIGRGRLAIEERKKGS